MSFQNVGLTGVTGSSNGRQSGAQSCFQFPRRDARRGVLNQQALVKRKISQRRVSGSDFDSFGKL